ncbi:MAG: 16S rRNA (cytosine(1402)-N(4))-methyltransferase [Candidatus Vogelbacteria bacterium RIFOXYD1_FULL_44_32]|uniref:Ribosomal RNA small subunit methyltransferase H n=1 Tax=Candidatus Vogelbacteria bacterium RIFOXYD1_FULL_44_32 TaxID=1802438 RepID=A0A1G2QE36_9BACT|nr:MAG: 16S rRNA (cytosine(1402)-N(4))-methyltransferase [Candidatus Vogelbacteria bacterium RIFOXYD1_FULL_44_32]
MEKLHTPVLLNEVIANLNLTIGSTVVDGTLGFGGHATKICDEIGPTGTLVGIDADATALHQAEKNLANQPCRQLLVKGNFRQLKSLCRDLEIESANAILLDLGVNSSQLDLSGRGFSFRRDEPLLMTLDDSPDKKNLTAADLVNTLGSEALAGIIYGYGEESFSRQIADAIVKARSDGGPITTTGRLTQIIEGAVPVWYTKRKIHPATKTFQALRIAVNDELGALEDGLAGAWDLLSVSGRLAVISFHSLEARIVKKFFVSKKQAGIGTLINKHAIKPTRDEVKANPRSRSAELRVISKN